MTNFFKLFYEMEVKPFFFLLFISFLLFGFSFGNRSEQIGSNSSTPTSICANSGCMQIFKLNIPSGKTVNLYSVQAVSCTDWALYSGSNGSTYRGAFIASGAGRLTGTSLIINQNLSSGIYRLEYTQGSCVHYQSDRKTLNTYNYLTGIFTYICGATCQNGQTTCYCSQNTNTSFPYPVNVVFSGNFQDTQPTNQITVNYGSSNSYIATGTITLSGEFTRIGNLFSPITTNTIIHWKSSDNGGTRVDTYLLGDLYLEGYYQKTYTGGEMNQWILTPTSYIDFTGYSLTGLVVSMTSDPVYSGNLYADFFQNSIYILASNFNSILAVVIISIGLVFLTKILKRKR